MSKPQNTSTPTTIIHALLLTGSLLCVLAFFLPWRRGARSPYLILQEPRPETIGVLRCCFYCPHILLPIITLLGLYFNYDKALYWITLIASISALIATLFVRSLYALGTLLAGPHPHIMPGGYAAIIGPIITLIGLILYKHVT